MNQSNKALRGQICQTIGISYDNPLADDLMALVTNHIKGALPKDYRRDGQDPNACLNHDKYTGACAACQRQQTRVYTLDEVHQLLEEVSNG